MFHRFSYLGRLEHRAFKEEAKWEKMCYRYGEQEVRLNAKHQRKIAAQRKKADLAALDLRRYQEIQLTAKTKDDEQIAHMSRPKKTTARKPA